MKDKIFQKLKQGYSRLGLGDEVLQAHAESLAATGLVTDENIDNVVNAQKGFLEGLQRNYDTRVSSATAKAREAAKKEFEDAAKAAAERKSLIVSKAEELGIPQYRIDEGFAIADDRNYGCRL